MQEKDVIIWKKRKISLSPQCSPKSSVSFTVWWERSARSGSFPDCWLFVPAWKLSCPSFGSFKNCQCMIRVGSKNPMLLNSWGPSSKNTCTLVHSAQSGLCSVLSLLSYPSSSFFLVSNWAIMFGVSETHGLFITIFLFVFWDLYFTSVEVRSGTSLQYSCLENPMDRGTWQATVHGVTKRWTWLSTWVSMHTLPLWFGGTSSVCAENHRVDFLWW